MVLEQLRGSGTLVVTRKPSLLAVAEGLPSALEDLSEAGVLPGYVANVVADAVFVRFLGGLTGRAGGPPHSPLLLPLFPGKIGIPLPQMVGFLRRGLLCQGNSATSSPSRDNLVLFDSE